MPTRYNLDVDLKTVVSAEVLEDAAAKKEANKVLTCALLIIALHRVHVSATSRASEPTLLRGLCNCKLLLIV
jgi:hypothetical protein